MAELTLETTKIETVLFQQRYYQIVGRLYAQLDDLAAQIANMPMEQNPEDSVLKAQAHSTQQQARRSSEEAGLIERQPDPAPVIDLNLKQAYRRAAKLMHPDLGISVHERQRRTKFMASLNLAYEHGDPAEIERLVVEFGQDPEAIVGEDVRRASRRQTAVSASYDVDPRASASRWMPNKSPKDSSLRQTIETAEALAQTLWVTWRMNWPRKSPSARPN